MKKLILIKLGGSVITDKKSRFKVRLGVITRLAREIKLARSQVGPDTLFLIGHGQGSFAHIPAAKYQTGLGNIKKNSIKGFCETSFMAIEPNRIVMREFLKIGLPVATFSPLSFVYAKGKKMQKLMLNHITKCFDIGVIPVIYGDVIMDEDNGFCIFSTEKTLGIIARSLRNTYKVEKIIECADTDGVYDSHGKTVEVINKNNFPEVKKWVTGSKSTDVTGGMLHKVEESLKLVKDTGIETQIINGLTVGNLKKAILGKIVLSTSIS